MKITKQHLNTPSLILDKKKLERNIIRMIGRCDELNVELRPHVKTPKSFDVINLFVQRGINKFTVSTLAEAKYLVENGIRDLFYAIPLSVNKIQQVCELQRQGAIISCLVDDEYALDAIEATCARYKSKISLWVEIDLDGYRTGIETSDPSFWNLLRRIDESKSLELSGLMSYGGSSYYKQSKSEVAKLSELHHKGLLKAQSDAKERGISVKGLSYGSTPAVLHANSLAGLSEVRCGIFAFQDLMQAGIGACEVDDIALSVLSTIVSKNKKRNFLVLDAGALALSKDRSTSKLPKDLGYGLIMDINTGKVYDDLYVSEVNQELGFVTTFSGNPIDFNAFPINSMVQILPNHADMTAAAYEQYCIETETSDITFWERKNGW